MILIRFQEDSNECIILFSPKCSEVNVECFSPFEDVCSFFAFSFQRELFLNHAPLAVSFIFNHAALALSCLVNRLLLADGDCHVCNNGSEMAEVGTGESIMGELEMVFHSAGDDKNCLALRARGELNTAGES